MKILELKSENFLRIKGVHITPEGNLVEIAGANGAGKSSVLHAIWTALRHADHILEQPLHEGATSGYVRLTVGDETRRLKVERRFTEANANGYLSVTTDDGAKYGSPQKMLNDLIGAIAFDPLSFSRMDAKQQAAELRRVARVEVDIDALDAERKRVFDQRTEVNREVKVLQAQAEGIEIVPGLPDAEIDIDDIVATMAKASEHNMEVQSHATRRAERARDAEAKDREAIKAKEDAARATETIARHRERIAELNRQIAELDQAIEQASGEVRRFQQIAKGHEKAAVDIRQEVADWPEAPAPIDVTALQAKVVDARTTNAAIALRTRRKTIEQQAEAAQARALSLTDALADIDQQKADAIAAAEMPVEGLGFRDGIVTFEGVPFSQASKAQQIRIGMAVAIAANPKLRVVHIEDGSLLDETSLGIVREMAEAADYQVWMERVDTSGDVGIVIEDGRVRGQEFESEIKPAKAKAEDTPPAATLQQDDGAPVPWDEPETEPQAEERFPELPNTQRRDFAAEAAARAKARAAAGADLFAGKRANG